MFIRDVFEPVHTAFCIFPVICVCLFCQFHLLRNLVILQLVNLKSSLCGLSMLLVPLILILPMIFASLVCLIHSLFIFLAARLSAFLYFYVISFCKRFGYSSLLRQYIIDYLSATVKVLFDDRMSFRSLAIVL